MTTGIPSTALVAAACLAVSLAAPQSPAFHAEARLVVLQVTVTNGHGERVTNLDRGSFAVFEDGRPQPITLFRSDDVPTSLGLIIDNSGSMRALRPRVEAAALAFVRASHPLDEVFVLNFADTPRIDVPFTHDVRVLEAGVIRVDAIGGTAMRDALVVAERYLRDHATHERRALLVITDGNDNASTVSTSECRTASSEAAPPSTRCALLATWHRRTLTAETTNSIVWPSSPAVSRTILRPHPTSNKSPGRWRTAFEASTRSPMSRRTSYSMAHIEWFG